MARHRRNDNAALGFLPRTRDPLSTLIYFKHGNAGDWRSYEVSERRKEKTYPRDASVSD